MRWWRWTPMAGAGRRSVAASSISRTEACGPRPPLLGKSGGSREALPTTASRLPPLVSWLCLSVQGESGVRDADKPGCLEARVGARAPALQPLAKPEQLTESAARTAQAWASKSALPSSLKGDANVCVRGNRRGQGHAGGGHATERRAPGGAQHGGGSPSAGPVAAPVARGAGAAGGHWRL